MLTKSRVVRIQFLIFYCPKFIYIKKEAEINKLLIDYMNNFYEEMNNYYLRGLENLLRSH